MDTIFTTLRFICYPFLWCKSKVLGIEKLKEELCNLFNKMHKTNTYKPEDYKLELRFFDGFFFIHKKTGYILASSGKLSSSGSLAVRDFDIYAMGFFNNTIVEQMKSPDMYYVKSFNSFYINYTNSAITTIDNNITFYVKFEDDFLLDEELIITLSLKWNNQFELIGIVKKTYDDIDPFDSKSYSEKMESPFDIQNETTKIIEDIIEKKKVYIPMPIIN